MSAPFFSSGIPRGHIRRYTNAGTNQPHENDHNKRPLMKKVISSILIAVILFFLLPLITRYFPQHRVLVWAVTAGVVSYLVALLIERVN